MHTRPFRLARAVIVAVLAVGGYFIFIRTSHIDRSLLSELVVHRTPISGLKATPKTAGPVSVSNKSFKVVEQSAKADPSQTGIYEIEWTSATKADLDAGILLQLLPDSRAARATLAESEKEIGAEPQLSGETLSAGTAFSIPGVRRAHAEAYAMTSSTTGEPNGYAYTVAFQQDRAVVTELVESSDTSRSVSGAASAAHDEDVLLRRAESGFSMVHAATPVVASAVYGAVGLFLMAGSYFAPELALDLLARRRARHQAKELDRARSQFRARGRRAVRRHRAPAWRQPGRR